MLKYSATSKDLEQVDEDHDDVQVQDQCANYIVINCELVLLSSQNQLGIHYEVNSKQEDTKSANEHLQNVAIEDNSENTEDEEGHSSDEDDAPLCSEVSLGGASISSTGGSNGNSANSCTDNGLAIFKVVCAVLLPEACVLTLVLEGGYHTDVCH